MWHVFSANIHNRCIFVHIELRFHIVFYSNIKKAVILFNTSYTLVIVGFTNASHEGYINYTLQFYLSEEFIEETGATVIDVMCIAMLVGTEDTLANSEKAKLQIEGTALTKSIFKCLLVCSSKLLRGTILEMNNQCI